MLTNFVFVLFTFQIRSIAADDNEAKKALIQKTLDQLERDRADFVKAKDALLAKSPATKAEYQPSEIDSMIGDSRKTLEIEQALVKLSVGYATQRKSHLPSLPELKGYSDKLAASNHDLEAIANTIISYEKQQLDILNQMQGAYHSKDTRRWNSLNQQYDTLRQNAQAASLKPIVAEQEEIVGGVKTALATAAEQLKSVEHHGEIARQLDNESASKEARKGFDTRGDNAGSLAATAPGTFSHHDPKIPKEFEKDSAISAAVKKRETAKKIRDQAQEEIKKLSPTDPKDQVKIVKLRQQEDKAQNEVIYENYSIGDRLKTLSDTAAGKSK